MMMSVLPVLPGFWPVPVLRPVPKYLHKILEKKGSGIGIRTRTNLKTRTGNRLLAITEPGTGFVVPFTCGTRIKIFEKRIRTGS
jgi:hypothetical protein